MCASRQRLSAHVHAHTPVSVEIINHRGCALRAVPSTPTLTDLQHLIIHQIEPLVERRCRRALCLRGACQSRGHRFVDPTRYDLGEGLGHQTADPLSLAVAYLWSQSASGRDKQNRTWWRAREGRYETMR